MLRLSPRLITAVLAVICSAPAAAQTTVVTQISVVFPSISRLSMTSGQALTLRSSGRADKTFAGTGASTYAIATTEANHKIVAQLDANMPSGLTLSAVVAAPAGGISAGPISLTRDAADVVTGIGAVSQSGLPIMYTVQANAAPPTSTRRTVVFTIIAGM